MGYNLAGIFGGAVPLIVAPKLTAAYDGIGVGAYLGGLALLSFVCVLGLRETREVAIDRVDPAGPEAAA
jgi:hypothetical protein